MVISVSSDESVEHYVWGDNCDGWHLVKSEQLSVIQERVPPGSSEVRHYHNHADQFFYVLSGIATMEVDGTVHQIEKHQGIHVKSGTPHQLKNLSNDSLEILVTSTPPSHGDRVVL